MRIGMEVTAAARQGAGIGRYVREMLKALAELDTQNQYSLFYASPHPVPFALPALPANSRARHLPFHDIWLARVWHRARAPLPVEWITGPIDLYHAPDFTLPPRLSAPGLLTVHDLSFERDPESAAPGLRQYLKTVVPRSVREAAHVLAVSQATKADLVQLYGAPPGKISVIYEGVDPIFRPTDAAAVRQKYGLGDAPYVLSVSTIQPRKNYKRLIQAMAQLPKEYRLVIAGGNGWLTDDIYTEAHKPQHAGRVCFTGFVDDADLPALYSGAAVFAYPSLYEGFGLPLLEAMACGTPTVTSNLSCLPEIAGGAAALVDPYDIDSIAAGIRRALEEREALARAGAARAAQFSWRQSARQLLALYSQVFASAL